MPGKLPQKARINDDMHPYGLPWLDSCYQETLLPNGPWQQISTTINDHLAERVRKQFDHPERKQIIFKLLGHDFVQKYFGDDDWNPHIIDELSTDEQKQLTVKATNWLKYTIQTIATELGYRREMEVNEETGSMMTHEMKRFLQHTRSIFETGLDRHLYLQEHEIAKRWQKLSEHGPKHGAYDTRDIRRLGVERERLGQGREYEENKEAVFAEDDESSIISSQPPSDNGSRKISKDSAEEPPVFWGMQSNSVGRSIVAMLKRDPHRFREVAEALRCKQLPGSLRSYMWLDVLLKQERAKVNNVNVEKILRERFGKAIQRRMGELKIKDATYSPISGLIDNSIVEIYSKTPAMKIFKTDKTHLKEAARALNSLYVYDRSYQPYHIYWLFALQLAFQESSGEREHVYELAMYLDLLSKGLFPTWPQIFASAQRVMERLRDSDQEFHAHLKAISRKDVHINTKEFLVQYIHQEKSEAQKILLDSSKSPDGDATSSQFLADPLIFLRKWMGEGFVGVLDSQAAIYIWDQCFLQSWQPKVLEDACLALLLLLRYKFIEAENYTDMRKVFLNEPNLVYTKDIQSAWIHVQLEKPLSGVPVLNRRCQGSGPNRLVVEHGGVTTMPSTPNKRYTGAVSNEGLASGLNETFDLYVDGIDGIPDNATIVKVTGRLVKTGELSGVSDLLALPSLESEARNPRFAYRQTINEDRATMDVDMLLLLRVYTVDVDSGTLVVVGNCLYQMFDVEMKKLKFGQHTRCLHQGMPNVKQGTGPLSASSLDFAPLIPACVVHFRIARHSQDYIPASSVLGSSRSSDDLPANASDEKVRSSYERDRTFPRTVADMAKGLQDVEHVQDRDDILEWIGKRLDRVAVLHNDRVRAHDINIGHLIRYRQEVGLRLQIARAYGLPENLYIQCFGRLQPGKGVLDSVETHRDHGEKQITMRHNFDSLQSAPVWLDEAKEWHLDLNEWSCFLVQIFGLDVVYEPTKDHEAPGRVLARSGGAPPALDQGSVIGWAVVPLFDGKYVLTGEHYVPIFKGQPKAEILAALSGEEMGNVLRTGITETMLVTRASLVVNVWDNHFTYSTIPGGLKRKDGMLELVGDRNDYERAEKAAGGKMISQFVIDSLQNEEEPSISSAVYAQEKQFFEKTVSTVFYNLMESALLTSGYGPL